MGQRTVRGFVWTVGLTLCAKLISLVGQVVLARLLTPESFGLIGLAYTLTAFTDLIQRAGIREVLVHRHRQFDRWATPAFWMSVTFGALAGFCMLVSAPLLAMLYREPRLVGLIMVLAVASPLNAAASVPEAKLQSQLRFGFLARVGVFRVFATMAITIGFAWAGLGAYSFVLPIPLLAACTLVLYWRAAAPAVRLRLRLRRWKYLLNDSLLLLAGSAVIAVIAQGDYFILGLMFPTAVVGLYFFAFELSMQAILLFSAQLVNVLFPALAAIQSVREQTLAYLRACRLLALCAMPFAALQLVAADPAIRLLFADTWMEAIPLLQVLSIATAFRVVTTSGGSLLQAQGRFRFRLILFLIYAPVFCGTVYAGARLGGGAMGVAVAVTMFYVVLGMFHLWIITRHGGGRWVDGLRIYGPPMLAAALSLGPAWWLAERVPAVPGRDAYRLLVLTLIGLPAYVLLIRWFAPSGFAELCHRIGQVRRRGSGGD